MEKVTIEKFKSSDGKIFDTQASCEAHEQAEADKTRKINYFYFDSKTKSIKEGSFREKDSENNHYSASYSGGWVSYTDETVTGRVYSHHDDWDRMDIYETRTFWRTKELLKKHLIKNCRCKIQNAEEEIKHLESL